MMNQGLLNNANHHPASFALEFSFSYLQLYFSYDFTRLFFPRNYVGISPEILVVFKICIGRNRYAMNLRKNQLKCCGFLWLKIT